VHKLEEGKIPMRALNVLTPNRPKPDLLALRARSSPLGSTVLVKARAWYLTTYFRVGDLTGIDGN
jgi:hypothetical protein